jgi:hypothetical protein
MGTITADGHSYTGFGVWRPSSGSVRAFPLSAPANFFVLGGWLADSRRFLAGAEQGLTLIDTDTGQMHLVQPPDPASEWSVSDNGHRLLRERVVVSSQVWLLAFK